MTLDLTPGPGLLAGCPTLTLSGRPDCRKRHHKKMIMGDFLTLLQAYTTQSHRAAHTQRICWVTKACPHSTRPEQLGTDSSPLWHL